MGTTVDELYLWIGGISAGVIILVILVIILAVIICFGCICVTCLSKCWDFLGLLADKITIYKRNKYYKHSSDDSDEEMQNFDSDSAELYGSENIG